MSKKEISQKIKEIEGWLSLNEGQLFLPIMEMDQLLHKQEVKHKKEMLTLLKSVA